MFGLWFVLSHSRKPNTCLATTFTEVIPSEAFQVYCEAWSIVVRVSHPSVASVGVGLILVQLYINRKLNGGSVAGSHRLGAGRDQRGASWPQTSREEPAETSFWMHVVVVGLAMMRWEA